MAYAADTIQIKPKLIESGLVDNEKYKRLPASFQRLFSTDTED